MRGCLFTLLLGGVVVVLIVFLGLPAAAAGLVTAGLTAAGLRADDTTVAVEANPPTDLLSGNADRVIVHATDATFRGFAIGSLALELGEVDVIDRTAGSVEGTLTDVTLPADAGGARLRKVTISGSGDRLAAGTTMSRADVEAMIASSVERATGTRPRDVDLSSPDRITVDLAGVAMTGRIGAAGGDVIVSITDGPGAGTGVVVLRGGDDLPMEITKVRVTDAGGLRIEGELAIGILG